MNTYIKRLTQTTLLLAIFSAASHISLNAAVKAAPAKEHLKLKSLINDAKKDRLEKVKEILTAAPGLLNEADESGMTPLHAACLENSTKVVRYLLAQEGIEVNKVYPIKDKHNKYEGGFTAAHFAATLNSINGDGEESTQCLVALAERGADFTAKDHNGNTPFLVASRDGANHAVENFFLQEADRKCPPALGVLLKQVNGDGNTGLHLAAREGRYKIITLLGLKIEVNTKNSNGLTPLHLAARDGKPKCVTWLLANGADRTIVTTGKGKKTALKMAETYLDLHPEIADRYNRIITLLKTEKAPSAAADENDDNDDDTK